MSSPRKCFVMMAFNAPYSKRLEAAIRAAIDQAGLVCVLANNKHVGEVPETIRREIREAVVCIADVTRKNANVAYELGIADTLDKRVILTSQDPEKTQFDIRHRHTNRYSASDRGFDTLTHELVERLRELVQRETLRMMFVPPDLLHKEGPFIIAANPLSWREGKRREGGFGRLTKTQVEYVGVRSLLLEFGTLNLASSELELLNPNDYRDHVAQEPMNLFSLGSPKSNRWTGLILAEFNKSWAPAFEFRADPDSNLRDIGVQVYKEGKLYEPMTRTYWHDFGLIIRGPNPFRPGWMFTVLAGRRGTGTEAACRAATDWEFLKKIGSRCDLSSVNKPFFAVVAMRRHESTYEADLASLRLLDAAPFSHRTRSRPPRSAGSEEVDPRISR